mgnify:FL=1
MVRRSIETLSQPRGCFQLGSGYVHEDANRDERFRYEIKSFLLHQAPTLEPLAPNTPSKIVQA